MKCRIQSNESVSISERKDDRRTLSEKPWELRMCLIQYDLISLAYVFLIKLEASYMLRLFRSCTLYCKLD